MFCLFVSNNVHVMTVPIVTVLGNRTDVFLTYVAFHIWYLQRLRIVHVEVQTFIRAGALFGMPYC